MRHEPAEPPRDDDVLPPRRLAFLQSLWALAHALDARSKWMASHLGVTGPQRMAIRLVGRTPGITAGELSRSLALHPSTVTGIVRRLEDAGFLARARDTSDSRRSMLVLTGAGKAVDRRRAGTVEEAVATVLARRSEADAALVRAFLEELAQALDPPAG